MHEGGGGKTILHSAAELLHEGVLRTIIGAGGAYLASTIIADCEELPPRSEAWTTIIAVSGRQKQVGWI